MVRRPFDAHARLQELRRIGSTDRFDIVIDRHGRWLYQGSPIGRIELVKLFATVMVRDDDGAYWLITPVEQGRIEVEDTPFVIVGMVVNGDDSAAVIRFQDNIEREHALAQPGQLLMRQRPAGIVPYLRLEKSFEARISTSVYYELAERAVEAESPLTTLGVWSSGHFFELGEAA